MREFIAILKLIYFFIEDTVYSILSKVKFFFIIALLIISYFVVGYLNNSVITGYQTIYLEKGIKFNDLSKKLFEEGFIQYPFLFKVFAKQLGFDKKVRYGEYRLAKGLNEYDLIEQLQIEKPIQRKLTIIEGERYSKIVPLMAKALDLDTNKLEKLFNDQAFLAQSKIVAKTIEGYLLPQTYFFNKGITEEGLLNFLIKKNKEVISAKKIESRPQKLNDHDLITLASIVQAECIYEDEMPIVASVYLNRLRRGMKLQADPTIQYFLDKPTRLLNKHLRIKHPYNTYMNKGLPPGPINNPGKAALEAVMNPVKTKYLYFVADGENGRHIFGRTLIEHNQNRKKLDALRRKLWRERRRKG